MNTPIPALYLFETYFWFLYRTNRHLYRGVYPTLTWCYKNRLLYSLNLQKFCGTNFPQFGDGTVGVADIPAVIDGWGPC